LRVVASVTRRTRSPAAGDIMRHKRNRRVAFALLAWAVVGAFMLPFMWMLLGSFKTTVDFLSYPPVWLFDPTLDNYRQVFADNAFVRYLLNSLVVAAGATIVGLLLGIPAAYALARWRRTAMGIVL